MIPMGIMLERRRQRQGLAPRRMPRIDLSDPVHQRVVVGVLALTIVNILIVSLAAYRAVEFMDSTAFCGQVCHTVMEPEFVAHREGPHSRVTCVECHVGSGAQSYVYYKLNGLRQLAHLVQGSYPKPVPSPVFNLRPATAHLRELPLAGKVPRRQGLDHPVVCGRRAEHELADAPDAPPRRRHAAIRPWRGHSLAHEHPERDRVRGNRQAADGNPVCPPEGRQRQGARVPRSRSDRRPDRRRRAPPDGLRRLSQPADSRVLRVARAGRRRSARAGSDPRHTPVCPS